MAGSKINDYSIGDENIQSVMLTLDKAYKGLHQVSLTNYNNTSASQIAAGSVVECGGALFKFDINESITGSPSNGTVYIRLVPAGDTITAEYTNTAPTWSDSKQGWYGTGGDANKRYLEFLIIKSSSAWQKVIMLNAKNGESYKKSFVKAQGISEMASVAQNIKTIDILSEYDNSTYSFSPHKSGYYLIIGNATPDTGGNLGALAVSLKKDGRTDYLFGSAQASSGMIPNFNFSGIVFLDNSSDYTMYVFSYDLTSNCATRITYYRLEGLI